jgi:hypothetical protein
VSSLIDPSRIRWIGFSHFEADECGSLNEWLQMAPAAQPVCSMVGASVVRLLLVKYLNTNMILLKALLVATLCLSLSGCDVVFISPLIDPKDATVDTRLVGKWSVPDSPLHEAGYIHIKRSGQKLIIASVTSKKLKDKLMKEFYTISCNERSFIVAEYTGRAEKKEQKGHLVVRYRIENDSLKLWLAIPAMFKAAIKEGKLHGKVGEAFDSTIIVDPANEALKFLCSSDDQMFEYLGEVKRID